MINLTSVLVASWSFWDRLLQCVIICYVLLCVVFFFYEEDKNDIRECSIGPAGGHNKKHEILWSEPSSLGELQKLPLATPIKIGAGNPIHITLLNLVLHLSLKKYTPVCGIHNHQRFKNQKWIAERPLKTLDFMKRETLVSCEGGRIRYTKQIWTLLVRTTPSQVFLGVALCINASIYAFVSWVA